MSTAHLTPLPLPKQARSHRTREWARPAALLGVMLASALLWYLIFTHPRTMAAAYGSLFALVLMMSFWRSRTRAG